MSVKEVKLAVAPFRGKKIARRSDLVRPIRELISHAPPRARIFVRLFQMDIALQGTDVDAMQLATGIARMGSCMHRKKIRS